MQDTPHVVAATVALCGALLLCVALFKTRVMESMERAALAADLRALQLRAAAAAAGSAAGSAASSPPLTALVTGANSGIGFTLATMLARSGVRVLLGCRHAGRGADAVARIQAAVGPAADVRLLLLDVADPASIRAAVAACTADLSRGGAVPHIDYLFANAGIMPVSGYRWAVPIVAFFRGSLAYFLTTGRSHRGSPHFIAHPEDDVGSGGAPAVFATHVLGHLYLVKEAADLLAPLPTPMAEGAAAPADPLVWGPDFREGRIVWTGSRAASASQVRWEHLEPPVLLQGTKTGPSGGRRGAPSPRRGAAGAVAIVATSVVSPSLDSPASWRERSGHERWLAATAAAGGPTHGEAYGEAKHATDLLNVGVY